MKGSRIALLVQTYLPDHVGGTEIYVKHLAEGLTQRGHTVAVVFHGVSRPKMEGQTYETIALPLFRPDRRAHGFRRARGVPPPGFPEFLKSWKPDLAHFHSFAVEAGTDHARALREAKIPYFFTYHLPAMTCLRGTLMRWGREACNGLIDPNACGACLFEANNLPRFLAPILSQLSLPWRALPEGPWMTRIALPSLVGELRKSWSEFSEGAKHLIACSQGVRDVLLVNGVAAKKITVLRQALPGKRRTRSLRIPTAAGRPLKLGFFGRLAPEKGVDLLLAATDLLHARGTPVVCELVGPCTDPRIEAVIRNALNGKNDRVRHVGILHGDPLLEWIRSVDLMVFPSRWIETGPLTVLEAWDQGTLAIGTDLGGIREFFSTNGLESLLFRSEDPASIAEAIGRAASWKGSPPSVEVPGLEELLDETEALYRR